MLAFEKGVVAFDSTLSASSLLATAPPGTTAARSECCSEKEGALALETGVLVFEAGRGPPCGQKEGVAALEGRVCVRD